MSGGVPVTVGSRSYRTTPDLWGRDRAFIIGAVLDDADGREMAREVTVTSDERLVFAAKSQREIALAGNPAAAFADHSVAHSVTASLRASGYRSLVETITLPAFPELPHRHDFALRRLPFTLSGRVYGRSGGPNPTYDPIAAATIALSPVPAPGGELPLLLRQPLRADPGPGATLRRRALAAQGTLTALADVAAGAELVAVADGSGVAAGELLRFGPAHRRFYAGVAQVIGHPDAAAPAALIRLTEGLAGAVAKDATFDRFSVGGFSGSTAHFVGRSYSGEAVVWLDALPSTTSVLVLREAGQPDRYHDADVLTGPAGDYRAEGVARLGNPQFSVSAAGFTTKTSSYPAARVGAGPLDWYLVP